MISPKTTPVEADLTTQLVALNDIAAQAGTKVKESLLEHYLDYTSFRQLVVMMLDPYITFGINNFTPCTSQDSPPATYADLMDLLTCLSKRELTGGAARVAAGSLVASGVPADLMTRLLNKDPKAGFGATLVNKVMKGLLPEFPYMRCSLPEKSNMDKWNWSKGIFSQLKADGMFMTINIDTAGQITLMSRQGTIYPNEAFGAFCSAINLALNDDTQTHGEMVVYQSGKLLSRQEGNGIINSVVQGGAWPEGCRTQFMAWDQIPMVAVQPKGKCKIEYQQRYMNLLEQLTPYTGMFLISLIPTRVVYSKREAYEHFQEVLLQGCEGTVVKDPDMPWADGTSKDQVKLKLEFIVDLRIVGFTKGNGKFAKSFGAIMMETCDGLLKVNVSGMDDKTRQDIHDNRDKYLFSIAAVEANAVFKPSASNAFHSLSHPRLSELRAAADKSVADSLAQVFSQEQAAMNAAAAIGK
jgi:DNA ligase-1